MARHARTDDLPPPSPGSLDAREHVLAAGIARELRNPLFGISSAAQLLRFRAQEDPVVEKNVGRILREVERLNRMVTSLLDYARPQAPRLAPGDPDAVWDGVLEAQRGRLESKALHVRRTRAEPAARARIDAELLAQLFDALLANAIDAAPDASDLVLESSTDGGHWACRLTNAGAPIPPEALPHIFEPFFTTKPTSSGLGLALAQRIAEAHDGVIAAESSSTGTTTVVRLKTEDRD
jgi:signal transduction histidine kinase